MLRSNADTLVQLSVMGQVVSPAFHGLPSTPHIITRDGTPKLVPSWGGIVYNVRVGMTAFGWVGDNIEPGVAIRHPDSGPNEALNVFSCVGNDATIMSGDGKGARGTVTGKSGRFAEHVIIDFDPEVLELLALGDKINVKAHGIGFRFDDFPGIAVKSCSPRLIASMDLAVENGKLSVPVVAAVPADIMGAGAGLTSEGGSISIQTGDTDLLAEHGLSNLRLGDVVAMTDYVSSFGHGYMRGAVGIGVVCHADSYRAGYGPGLTVIMTSPAGEIAPRIVPEANIASLLGIGAVLTH
jgi:hypothetical protein